MWAKDAKKAQTLVQNTLC